MTSLINWWKIHLISGFSEGNRSKILGMWWISELDKYYWCDFLCCIFTVPAGIDPNDIGVRCLVLPLLTHTLKLFTNFWLIKPSKISNKLYEFLKGWTIPTQQWMCQTEWQRKNDFLVLFFRYGRDGAHSSNNK